MAVILISRQMSGETRKLRFDPEMPKAEAERIAETAIKNDDVETYMAIQLDWFLPRSIVTPRPSLKLIRESLARDWSVPKAIEKYQEAKTNEMTLRYSFWESECFRFWDDYAPRITLEVARTFKEIEFDHQYYRSMMPELKQIPDIESVMRLYLRQGHLGGVQDFHSNRFILDGLPQKISYLIGFAIGTISYTEQMDFYRNHDQKTNRIDPWMRRIAGVRYWEAGDFASAEPLLKDAAESFEDDPLGRFAWAESSIGLGKPINPVEMMGAPCRKGVHYTTQESTRLKYRAMLHDRIGKRSEAIADAEASVATDPHEFDSWDLLSKWYGNAGDHSKAENARSNARKWKGAKDRLAIVQKKIDDVDYGYEKFESMGVTPEFTELRQAAIEAEWDLIVRASDEFLKQKLVKDVRDKFRSNRAFRPPYPDRFFMPRPIPKHEFQRTVDSGVKAR
jgi:hypothetical protein